ncbi:hypothetical protein [Frankia sp. Cas3]|uniref:hypothetical protein n=1 Tax=Frankia sp. Cas3 TaxID=3073926 RepID=UPI002AD5390C|nr:hypothetical protein [Frankia sp. Cas3]
MFTIQPAGVHLALVLAVLVLVAMARTPRLTLAGDLPSRGTVPVQRKAPDVVLALAVGDVPDDRWQHGLCRSCGHLRDDHSFVGCARAAHGLQCPCPIRSAIAPHCIICGDRIDGEVYDCGAGPEHLDCHHDDVDHGTDADAPPVPPVDEVDPDLITEILRQLERPGMLADLTGWQWDDSDYTRAAAFIRTAVEASRGGAA